MHECENLGIPSRNDPQAFQRACSACAGDYEDPDSTASGECDEVSEEREAEEK